MSEEKKEKTIREEMDEQKIIITVTVDDKGSMTVNWNRGLMPLHVKGILSDAVEVMYKQLLFAELDKMYMRKLGLKK